MLLRKLKIAFSQNKEVREVFIRGRKILHTEYDGYTIKVYKLPFISYYYTRVTYSTQFIYRLRTRKYEDIKVRLAKDLKIFLD